MKITHIGLDLAKNVFELHAIDGRHKVAAHRRLRRAQVLRHFAGLEPCLVGLEACPGAHYWARELRRLGHEVRLMAPRFVQPYRKGDKNDRNDAQAICEALTRPSMRFVAVKSAEQQAVLTMHRARELLSGQRKALINQVRGLLMEYGLVLAEGGAVVRRALPAILEDADNDLPTLAREVFAELYQRLVDLDERLAHYDRRLVQLSRAMPGAQTVMQMVGVGPQTATAVLATVGDVRQFANGRQFSAWLGLVPRQYSSGHRIRYGRITKRGDRYLRTLLIQGARAALRTAHRRDDRLARWACAVRDRRGHNKAVVALAAKHSRIIWALLAHDDSYRPQAA
jgi:transposase